MSNFGGKIIRDSRETVKGSLRQGAWRDNWVESFDIEFDGDITNDVARAIVDAFCASDLHNSKSQNSWGALRWMCADGDIRVDRFQRKLLVERSMGIAD